MLKALVKKEFLSLFNMLLRRSKKGVSNGYIVFYVCMMLYVAGVFFFMMGSLFSQLAEPLMQAGLFWLYFALAGIIAAALGIIGSVFMAQSQLFDAKDNELLLSMPIPTRAVIASRMISLCVQNFFFEILVLAPALFIWAREGGGILSAAVASLAVPFLSLALTCALGFIIAYLASKVRNKSLFTTVLSFAFIGAYLYFYSNLQKIVATFIAQAASMGGKIKSVMWPFYMFGRGAAGEWLCVLVFIALCLAVFGLVFYLLDRSFVSIATANRGLKKLKYREKTAHVRSPLAALREREMMRFFKTPAYVVNCAFGSIMLFAAGTVALIKSELLVALGAYGLPAAIGALFLILATTSVSAPSVSLEGKNLWIAQSMPVSPFTVLRAKMTPHLVVCVPPALYAAVCFSCVFRFGPLPAVLCVLSAAVFSVFFAEGGLICNLLMPNFNWVSETVVIKQSMSVMIAMFGGWGIGGALAIVFFAVKPPMLPFCAAVLLFGIIADAFMFFWLKKYGAARFSRL